MEGRQHAREANSEGACAGEVTDWFAARRLAGAKLGGQIIRARALEDAAARGETMAERLRRQKRESEERRKACNR